MRKIFFIFVLFAGFVGSAFSVLEKLGELPSDRGERDSLGYYLVQPYIDGPEAKAWKDPAVVSKCFPCHLRLFSKLEEQRRAGKIPTSYMSEQALAKFEDALAKCSNVTECAEKSKSKILKLEK